MVKGVEFVVDDDGQKKAVLIDLKKHGEIWEDFYDALPAKERESEPRESLKEVKVKRTASFIHNCAAVCPEYVIRVV